MTDTTSPAERAAALKAHLTRHRATEGFRLVDVRAKGEQAAVVFRWQRNPHTFVIDVDRDFVSFFGEEEGAGLETWCEDVRLWLMEELDTGHLTRAVRHRDGDEIVLTVGAAPDEREDEPHVWVHEVPQYSRKITVPWRIRGRLLLARLRGRPASVGWAAWAPLDAEPGDGLDDGARLGDAGLDPVRVRRIRDEGRLPAVAAGGP